MREDAFRFWMSTAPRKNNDKPLNARTVSSRLSNCRKVERYEGDLDHHFDQDSLCILIQRLGYSKEDERKKRLLGTGSRLVGTSITELQRYDRPFRCTSSFARTALKRLRIASNLQSDPLC